MSYELKHINYIEELSPQEKDRLLSLLVDRLGLDIVYYKLDGEGRIIDLLTRPRC